MRDFTDREIQVALFAHVAPASLSERALALALADQWFLDVVAAVRRSLIAHRLLGLHIRQTSFATLAAIASAEPCSCGTSTSQYAAYKAVHDTGCRYLQTWMRYEADLSDRLEDYARRAQDARA